MNDWKRISVGAIALVVLLRLSIGWQFLYEGIWKYKTLNTPNPWSADGYLKSAQGPLRDTFRGMTGDPDELEWLDFETMNRRWTDWSERFQKHFGLTGAQQAEFIRLLEGPAAYSAPLESVPAGVDLQQLIREKLHSGPKLTYDPGRKQLILDATTPLTPEETAILESAVPVARDADGRYFATGSEGAPDAEPNSTDVMYYKAVESLGRSSSKLSYRQRLRAALKGDPELVGVIAQADQKDPDRYSPVMGTEASGQNVELLRYGELQVYKDMLADYRRQLASNRQDSLEFRQSHLETLWNKIQAKRSELVGPIKALDKSLKEDAIRLLEPAQLAMGPLPPPAGPLQRASQAAMWALLILGPLLLAGCCTRVAALAGAAMLLSFYMVIPPWPGVPQPPGPEHSLIVNKNLIEALALLAIAAMPSGSWFGLDGILARLFLRRRKSTPRPI